MSQFDDIRNQIFISLRIMSYTFTITKITKITQISAHVNKDNAESTKHEPTKRKCNQVPSHCFPNGGLGCVFGSYCISPSLLPSFP